MAATQSELRLARLIDEREHTQTLHEGKLADVGDDKLLSEADEAQITAYRERVFTLDKEIARPRRNRRGEQQGAGAVPEDPARPGRRRRCRRGRRRASCTAPWPPTPAT